MPDNCSFHFNISQATFKVCTDKVLSDRCLGVAAAQLASAVVAVGHCCCQLGAVAARLRSLLDTGHGGGRGLGDDGAPLAQAGLALKHALNILIACCLLKLGAVHAVAESINDPDLSLQAGETPDPEDLAASALNRVMRVPVR